MTRPRPLVLGLLTVLVHALARETDRALGLVLRSELAPRTLLGELWRSAAAAGGDGVVGLLGWSAGGLLLWLLLALLRSRRERSSLVAALEDEAGVLHVLWLRPALTLLALLSVALRPTYPYAFTLPVALTQDWSIGQDVAAAAVFVAVRAPRVRWPAPRAAEVLLIAFLGYALLAPEWAWRWEGHPGNEPKYLRQAVALGVLGTFDAEGVSTAMEDLPARPFADSFVGAAATVVRESGRMLVALGRGEAGRGAIRASRITRQTVRGQDGGVYYVLAPGPSLMLAPALRVDRAIDLARGDRGRVAVATLLWCLLAALLVAAVFLLLRDATGRDGLAAALALGFAVLPPFLFYSYQFYPEMPGALVLAVAFRLLALRKDRLVRHAGAFGWLLATLPWLHQKFLPVWLVIVATAVVVVARDGSPGRGRRLAALLVPQALGLYLTALYNFAITGSVRPDALFLAWGPGGVTGARVGQGLLGLLLDARFGILPWVPVLMLAGAGLAGPGLRRFAIVLPSAVVYYLTVASADNWSGAVCNLGRYFMPVAPLAVALVAMALVRGTAAERPPARRRAVVALLLVPAAWSALFAVQLWRDPQAANDSALLLAKSTYADGNAYIPNLFIRHWADAAPGLWARVGAWVLGGALLAIGLRTARSPGRALAGLAAGILVVGLLLEQWPTRRTGVDDPDTLVVDPAIEVTFSGAARVREDEAILGPGRVELLVRDRRREGEAEATALRATVGGEGLLHVSGLPPLRLRPTGGVVDLPLLNYHVVEGRDGRRATFSRLGATVSGQAVMRFGPGDGAAAVQPAPLSAGESDQAAEPEDPGSR